MKASRIFLIRHGETGFNREDRFRGWLDVPLDKTGLRQAAAVGRVLAPEPIKAVYSSPLSRAMDTARAVASPRGLQPVAFEPFKDFNFGEWQGKLREEARKEWPDLYRLYESDSAKFVAPGGESMAGLIERVGHGLLKLAEKHGGQTVAAASHAVVCKAALLVAKGWGLDRYWDVKMGNCAISLVVRRGGAWAVELEDDRRHLMGID